MYNGKEIIIMSLSKSGRSLIQAKIDRCRYFDDYQLSVRNGKRGRPPAFAMLPSWKLRKQ